MACEFITNGRLLECKNFTAGLVNAYVAKFANIAPTVVADEMTGLGTLAEVFKFELKNTGNVPTETLTSSRENGTTFYDISVELAMTGLSAPLINQAKLLTRDRFLLFLEDNNGLVHCFGLKNGIDKTGGVREIAGDLGGFYGLKMTLTGQEPQPAPILSSSAKTSLLALVSANYVND